jgi:hypothetical protein
MPPQSEVVPPPTFRANVGAPSLDFGRHET